MPYNTKINRAIRKTFNKSDYKISFRTKNNAFRIINNKILSKDHGPGQDFEKAGIYRIDCTDCEKFYIGQTSRNFKIRFKEHIQALKSGNKTSMKSNFAEHLLESNHEYKNMNENLKILEFENNKQKLSVKEDFHIYNHFKETPQNLLNSTNINKKNLIFDKISNLN